MTTRSRKKAAEIVKKFQSLFTVKSGEEKIEDDAYMLMSGFLSEIEGFQRASDKYSKRKDLAEAIGTSPSYLTQVFRGDKPLNFQTIAKIQDVLEIRFEIRAKRFRQQKPALDADAESGSRRRRVGKEGKITKKAAIR